MGFGAYRARWRAERWLAVGVLAAALAGCSRRPTPGQRFDCTCELLTDTDELSAVRVTVCAAADDEARPLAQSCAQSGAPATIQACRCTGSAPSSPCAARGCEKVYERR